MGSGRAGSNGGTEVEEKEKSSQGSGEQERSSGGKAAGGTTEIVKMKKALRLQKFLIGALACVVVAGAVAVVGYQKNWFGLKNSDPGTAAGADIDRTLETGTARFPRLLREILTRKILRFPAIRKFICRRDKPRWMWRSPIRRETLVISHFSWC